jgi:hypothetical protein
MSFSFVLNASHVQIVCLWLYLGYVPSLYVPIYLVGDAYTKFHYIMLVYVSTLACCRALCLFEKHMLAFVELIHALPTRARDSNPILALGRKVPNSCIQGEFLHQGEKYSCINGRKIERNAFVQWELPLMHLGALLRLNFSCALLLMVSSPFASP